MKLTSSAWMQELDAAAIHDIGIPSIVLMENASQGAARFFAEEFPLAKYSQVLVLVGRGNNGGDGLAVGRILHQTGYRVEFILLSPAEQLNPDPAIQFKIVQNLGLKVTILHDPDRLADILRSYRAENSFIVDAIFGTGLTRPLTEGLFKEVIDIVNAVRIPVAAVDVPSGLSEAFLPEAGSHIKAEVTATFQALKIAHIYPDGNLFCGQIRVIDIGIPRELLAQEKYDIELIGPGNFKDLFRKRAVNAHKGNFGHVLDISGSLEKPGAGILSAQAVLKGGAGLCTAAVPVENRLVAVAAHPEIMTLVYRGNDDLLPRLAEFNTVLAGPGLGCTDATFNLVSMLLSHARSPLVLDADAINVLAGKPGALGQTHSSPVVLTPHPAEFSGLTGLSVTDIQKKRLETGRQFARDHQVFLVLKGHHTVIATPSGRLYVNQSGNPGMATAGSGDVLSGLIAGMIAQFYGKFDMPEILQAAVFIHGFAGDLAGLEVGETSLMATDIIRFMPAAILKLDEYKSRFQFA